MDYMEIKHIISPVTPDTIKDLHVGDNVLIDGVIYVARDAAHRRLVEAMDKGEKLPFDIKGQTVYYMGPSPAPPGKVIGACGPTTSARMDMFTPRLLEAGLKAMIGKGNRSQVVREAIKKYQAVYFMSYGGAGALLAKTVKKAELVSYPDLGAEAILRLEVESFPAVVANDMYGRDLFEEAMTKYRHVSV
jgi:fumarate hydratase subunit beta